MYKSNILCTVVRSCLSLPRLSGGWFQCTEVYEKMGAIKQWNVSCLEL